MKAAKDKNGPSKKKWVILFSVIVCCIIVAFIVMRPKESIFPPELIGLWHTDDQRYIDRYFTIDESTIILGQGGDRQALFFIKDVDKENLGEYNFFKLNCIDEENNDEYIFQIQYKFSNGVVNFVNINNVIWTKTKKE